MGLTSIDRRIVASLCGDLPESLAPLQDIATRLGISEKKLLSTIGRLRRSKILRRFGATVDQRRLGFHANAMVVWQIPEERVEEAAGAIVSCPAVTHCYQRESRPSWPYNLYAMIHGENREKCEEKAAGISRTIRSHDYRLFFTVREFKKTTPVYFSSGKS
jgi:DNA-binding Lrp family transcriptional regulator